MKNPNIVFVAPCTVEIIDKEIPAVKEDEVLVEIVRTSISAGTERANLVGDANVSYQRGPVVTFPRQGGYSASGIVVKIGERVSRVKVGDRVACSWTKHARYFAIKERRVYPIPREVGMEEAALVHIATFSLAAIRKCRLELGESAIVMGQGILGQLAVVLLRAAGAYPVIAVDPVKEKRERALSLGADYALDPFSDDFAKTVKEVTRGGAKVAIEVTGRGEGLDMVLDTMAPFGRVALLGCTRNSDFSIDYYRKVHGPGITLIGAHTAARPTMESAEDFWTELDDATAILDLMAGKRLNLRALIEETHPICEAKEVYERLAKGGSFPVVQFDWSLT